MNNIQQKTRIVCTIGPSTCSEEALFSLIKSGMTIVRLNGSHNTREWHRDVIRKIRKISNTTPILVDLPGRKIRTVNLKREYSFCAEEIITLTSSLDGEEYGKIPVNYNNFHNDIRPGDKILADDGTLEFKVIEVVGRDVLVKAKSDGILKSAKGINVPYVKVNTPLVSDRDLTLIEMCREEEVDYVGISFVENQGHIDEIKKYLHGTSIKIISKVENQFALDNLEEIIKASFGVMIDRGDLSAETNLFDIAIVQKKILKIANTHGVPVIIATEMMHNMVLHSSPTKSEVNDITNAVLDGASAVMLSGETAAGMYPFDAVRIMSKILLAAEEYLFSLSKKMYLGNSFTDTPFFIGDCIQVACETLPITKVVCVTKTGYALKVLNRHRIKQPLLVFTEDISTARKLRLYWGADCYAGDAVFTPLNVNLIKDAAKKLYDDHLLTDDDLILSTSVRYPSPANETKLNCMEIHRIIDLKNIF